MSLTEEVPCLTFRFPPTHIFLLQIWFGYASAKMTGIARAQKSSCTCSTNTLQYSEQHLERLGSIPSGTIAQELPFKTCSSSSSSSVGQPQPPPQRSGCFAAKLDVGRPQTSFEWAGLFTLHDVGTYEWNFRSNGAPFGEFSYPDPAIGIWIVASPDLESVQADAQAALENEGNSTVVVPGGTISLAEPRRQSLQFKTDALSTKFQLVATAPGQTYAVYTEHMPWEFAAVHLVSPTPATPAAGGPTAVFPSGATEFDLEPGSALPGAVGDEIPCIRARARNCRKAAKEGRCRWLKEEQQCTTCSGCSCHSKAPDCKAASPGGCRWWEKQCVPLKECAADDYSDCCGMSKQQCVGDTSCRWDRPGKICRGTAKQGKECSDVKGWKDSDKDTCDTYRSNLWCGTQPDGTEGTGLAWRRTDKFSDFADPNSGLHAGEACCGCGGGAKGSQQKVPTTKMTTTTGAPEGNGGEGEGRGEEGEASANDPDDGAPLPATTNQTTTSTQAAATAGESCVDLPRTQSWRDADRDSCFVYELKKWCGMQEDGQLGYGKGWSDGELFEDYVGTGGLHAGEACCACGGGGVA